MGHNPLNKSCPRNNIKNETICICGAYRDPTDRVDYRSKTSHQQRVEEFMTKAGQEVPDQPMVPSAEVRELRASLVFEEAVNELINEGLGVEIYLGGFAIIAKLRYMRENKQKPEFKAIYNYGLTAIADGCADTSVVTVGTLSACGIADMELLEEVDRSNLSKFCLPSCPVHGGDMIHHGGGKYQCPAPISGLPGTTALPRQCHLTAEGPYRSPEGRWVKGPQYSPADIEGVLARQRPAVQDPACEICGVPCLEGLQVCYDHCKLDDNLDPRDPTIAECVSMVEEEFARAAIVIRSTQQAHRYAPNPLGGAPIDITTFHPPKPPSGGDVAEGVIATAAVQAKQLKFDSGGIVMCPHCRNPLSDEMVKDLKSGKRLQGGCPGCAGIFSYDDLSNPRIH